jgi:hypothetical protein
MQLTSLPAIYLYGYVHLLMSSGESLIDWKKKILVSKTGSHATFDLEMFISHVRTHSAKLLMSWLSRVQTEEDESFQKCGYLFDSHHFRTTDCTVWRAASLCRWHRLTQARRSYLCTGIENMEEESEVTCARKFTGTIGILLETKLEGQGRNKYFRNRNVWGYLCCRTSYIIILNHIRSVNFPKTHYRPVCPYCIESILRSYGPKSKIWVEWKFISQILPSKTFNMFNWLASFLISEW